MKELFQKYKWKMAWSCYALLLLLCGYITISFNDRHWFTAFLQAFALLLTVYPTVLIFVQSRADSESANRKQLDHFQTLNQNQIEENRKLNEVHIKTVEEANAKQIDAIAENTNKQITEFKNLTDEQIKAIRESTKEQIDNYAKQTEKVVKELTTNSTLLAEILLRQLDEAMVELGLKINEANEKYADRKQWKLLRSPADKQAELTKWERYIASLQQKMDYIRSKWQQVKDFLGNEN